MRQAIRKLSIASIARMASLRQPSDRPSVRSFAQYLAVALCALVTFAGCGPKSDRLAIDGKVILNGTALDMGSIRFSSEGGQKLFATGAMVKDGEFHIPQQKGLPPGKYHVEINSPDTKAPLVTYRGAPGEPVGPPTAPERIPADYNSNSKQSVEIGADKDNQFVFDIVSGRAK